MKDRDKLKLLNLVDEKYLEEADPAKAALPQDGKNAAEGRGARRRRRTAGIAIAASVAVCISAGALALFLPFSTALPDVSMYADSEYYSLIQKLNEYTYRPPKYKNNFEKLMATLAPGGTAPDIGMDMAPGDSGDSGTAAPDSGASDEGYNEVTDNQTAGVTEADKIKRSDEYIYYLDGNNLRVFSIDGEQSAQVGEFNVFGYWQWEYREDSESADGGSSSLYNNISCQEFFLSEDCTTVTVISTWYDKTMYATGLLSLDVGDAQNISVAGSLVVEGQYTSARVRDGKLLLATGYYLLTSCIDFADPSTYVPMVDCGDGFELLPAEDVISPDKLTSSSYTVVVQCDEQSLSLLGSAAYISYSSDFYASADNVYFWRGYGAESEPQDGVVNVKRMTEISVLGYGDGLELVGSFAVEGTIKNRYCLDEYDGVLRVFTTMYEYARREEQITSGGVVSDVIYVENRGDNASLYCIDLSDFSLVASVENFAPEGESVYSARFDGDTAYVCTAVDMADPVFIFDLSDYDNITYRETGTVAGFSTSLIDFTDDILIGIGEDGDGAMKIEAYTGEQGSVVSVSKITFPHTHYSADYKSYYVDRKNKLIGLGVNDYAAEGSGSHYLVVGFDGTQFTQLIYAPIKGYTADMRGVYVDGYFYMFGEQDFKVVKLDITE